MISRHTIGDFIWIDLLSPDAAEIKKIAEEYNLDYLTANELESPTPRPRTRAYQTGKFLCVVLHIPAFRHSHQSEELQEIDFVIGRNILLTARYENIDALDKFSKEAEVQDILGKSNSVLKHPFLHLVQELQASLFDELSYIEDWVSIIEKKIFSGEEKKMVITISEAGKNLLNFRKALKPHREILEFLKENGEERFGRSFKAGVETLIKSEERLEEIAHNNLDMLLELRATNDSILTTNQNEVMKTLTVLAFMTIPASVVGTIFNMSVDVPLKESPYAFWIIIGIMMALSLIMFIFFKIKKWI